MTERYLTITLQPDWKGALRAMAKVANADTYQGEVLNFESPGHFFGQLTEKRWEIVRAAQGKGELSVRELARALGRDVRRSRNPSSPRSSPSATWPATSPRTPSTSSRPTRFRFTS